MRAHCRLGKVPQATAVNKARIPKDHNDPLFTFTQLQVNYEYTIEYKIQLFYFLIHRLKFTVTLNLIFAEIESQLKNIFLELK